MFLQQKKHFPTEKCTLLQKNAVSCSKKKHTLSCRKKYAVFGWAQGRNLQEIAGGFQGSRIKNATQLSQELWTLEGPTRKPRHASVFSTHSDTQSVPAFHCIRMFKGTFSTCAFLKRTDTLSIIALKRSKNHFDALVFLKRAFRHARVRS